MSDRLWQLLNQHRDLHALCDRLCSCGIQHPIGHVYHLTEVITAEFLVVPCSEITGTEYGYRHAPEWTVFQWTRYADELPGRIAEIREAQRQAGMDPPRAEGVSRPVIAWSPLAEEVGDGR